MANLLQQLVSDFFFLVLFCFFVLYVLFCFLCFVLFCFCTVADAAIGSQKCLSIHYLISIWTTYWWNLNKIVWSELYKILSFLTKNA